MSTKKAIIVTPEFRVSFPNVYKARKNDMNGKDEYSLVALFPKGANLDELKKWANEALKEKFGPDAKKWPKPLKSPFRNQGERKKTAEDGTEFLPDGYEEGAVFMNLRSQRKPIVVDRTRTPINDDRQDEFYPGCYARAQVTVYAYDVKGAKGVAFGLSMIQKTRDGEPFSGRPKPEDAFAPLEGVSEDASAADSTSIF